MTLNYIVISVQQQLSLLFLQTVLYIDSIQILMKLIRWMKRHFLEINLLELRDEQIAKLQHFTKRKI